MTYILCLLQVLLEVVACTVVFQFVPEGSNDAGGRVPSYYDKLNSWVCLGKLLCNVLVFTALVVCFSDLFLHFQNIFVAGFFKFLLFFHCVLSLITSHSFIGNMGLPVGS
jgi:hypothetical protein